MVLRRVVVVALLAVMTACSPSPDRAVRLPPTRAGLEQAAIALQWAVATGDRSTVLRYLPEHCRTGVDGAVIRAALAQAAERADSDATMVTARARPVRAGRSEVDVHTGYAAKDMAGSSDSGWIPWRYEHHRWRTDC